MGYDKLINFFYKNLPNNTIEKVLVYSKNGTPNNKYNIYTFDNIFFDISFIIYGSITELEKDINYILKNIVALPYNENKIIIDNINNILSKNIWKLINFNLGIILDGNSIHEIITKFKTFLNHNNNINKLLFFYIYDKINYCINNIHDIDYIKSINIFFDGIPSYSKIIEQRKRRFKNYLESKNKKKHFNDYFKDINKNVILENGILYDYFEYIDYQFSFNKSFGPTSELIIDLEEFLNINLKNKYKTKKIFIDSAQNNGEADYKIFKYINDNKIIGEICIHSCDSDFLHLILINKILNKDNNYFYIRHYNDNFELFNAHKIINVLNDKYKSNNNLEYSLINNIIDFLFIIQLFENDILPINYNISVELSLSLLFDIHYSICKNKNFIVNMNSEYTIDFTLLLLFLKKLKLRNTIDIVILLKNFKLPYNFINICCIEMKMTIDDIINNLIIPYLGWEGNQLEDLNENDIRYILKKEEHIENPISTFNISENNKNELNNLMKIIFDYADIDNYGIKKLDKYINIDNNPYQTLYNILVHNTLENRNVYNIENIKQIKEFKHDIKNTFGVKEYYDVLISQTMMLFYDFNLYSPKNKIFYGYNVAPDIDSLINFIENNNMYDHMKNVYTIMKYPINSDYFDDITHHLFITPYLLENLYISKIGSFNSVDSLINITNNIMKNIWYSENSKDNFELKNIDPDFFIKNCNSIIKLLQSDLAKYINNNYKVLK